MPPDAGILLRFHRLAGRMPVLDFAMRLGVNDFFGPVVLFLIMLGLWFSPGNVASRRRNQQAIFLAVVAQVVVSAIMNLLNTRLHFDPWPRPYQALPQVNPFVLFYPAQDPSFPSHAAAVEFAMAASILFFNRRAGMAMLLVALVCGFARVYAGINYPLDIAGGLTVGVASSTLALALSPLLQPISSRLFRMLAWFGLADEPAGAPRRTRGLRSSTP